MRKLWGKAVLPRRDASDEAAAGREQEDQCRVPCSDLPAGQQMTVWVLRNMLSRLPGHCEVSLQMDTFHLKNRRTFTLSTRKLWGITRYKLMCNGETGRGSARTDAELIEERTHMRFDCARADDELFGNLRVCQSQ